MEFITCSTGMWNDAWFMGLELEQQHLYMHLFLSASNDFGFQEYNPGLWAFLCKVPILNIDALLAKYEADGKIKREGPVIWLVNSIKHMRLAGPNLTGALNGIQARWGNKAPGLVAACLKKYPPGTPSIRGKDGVPTGDDKTRTHGKERKVGTEETRNKLKEGTTSTAGPDAPADRVQGSKRTEKRALDQKALDELVATALPEKAHTAWQQLVDGMAGKNTNGTQEPSVPLRLLREIIELIGEDELSPAQVSHGLWACVNARGGAAGNKTYFRKAANGYTGEDFHNSGGGDGRGDNPPPSGRPPVPPPPPGYTPRSGTEDQP